MKRYAPPPVDSDEPLDPIEEIWVEIVAERIVRRIREDEAARAGKPKPLRLVPDDDRSA